MTADYRALIRQHVGDGYHVLTAGRQPLAAVSARIRGLLDADAALKDEATAWLRSLTKPVTDKCHISRVQKTILSNALGVARMTIEDSQAADDAVVLDEDGNPAGAPASLADEEPERSDEDVLAELKAEVAAKTKAAEDRRRAAEAAEAELVKARRDGAASETSRIAATELAIDNALASFEQQKANLLSQKAAARTAGDLAREAEIDDELAEVRHRILIGKGQKDQIKAFREREAAEAQTRRDAPPKPRNVLDSFTAPTREWLEAHPDAQPNGRLWNRARAADLMAKEEGLKPDTPEYFSYIEEFIGMKEPSRAANPAEAQQEVRRPAASAPPSRGNGAGQPRQRQTVRLTESERDLALRLSALGNTPQERLANYAKNKAEAIRRGEIPGAAA